VLSLKIVIRIKDIVLSLGIIELQIRQKESNKNNKAIISDGLSSIAPHNIILSNNFNQEIKRLALLYDILTKRD